MKITSADYDYWLFHEQVGGVYKSGASEAHCINGDSIYHDTADSIQLIYGAYFGASHHIYPNNPIFGGLSLNFGFNIQFWLKREDS